MFSVPFWATLCCYSEHCSWPCPQASSRFVSQPWDARQIWEEPWERGYTVIVCVNHLWQTSVFIVCLWKPWCVNNKHSWSAHIFQLVMSALGRDSVAASRTTTCSCRKPLIGTGRATSLLLWTNGLRKQSSATQGLHFWQWSSFLDL